LGFRVGYPFLSYICVVYFLYLRIFLLEGEGQTQEGNDPPFPRVEKGIGTGQQEEDDRNDVRNDEQPAGKSPKDRH